MVLPVELVLAVHTLICFLSPQRVWAIKGKCWGHLGVGGEVGRQLREECLPVSGLWATPSSCGQTPATLAHPLWNQLRLRQGLLWAPFTFRVLPVPSPFLKVGS